MLGVTIEHPMWLLLIVPAAALAIADALRRLQASRLRRAIAIAGRVLVITALALAIADPRWTGHRRDTTVVFLVDRSASVTDEALASAWAKVAELRAKLGPDERAAVVQFDAVADVAIGPGDPFVQPAQLRGPAETREATDIAAALRLGLGLIPPGAGGHLVVLGDGRSNRGDLDEPKAAAIARGIPISAVPTGSTQNDPAVAGIVLPADRVRAGATLDGHVDVDAGGVTGTGHLEVTVGGTKVLSKDVPLDGKHTSVPFTYSVPPTVQPGVASVEAKLSLDAGTANHDTTNDHASSRVVVERPPHILILDGDENGAGQLAAALRAEQMDVAVTSAITGPKPDLAGADLILLVNAPVKAGSGTGLVDDELGEKLVKWVNDGGGLIVVGGPQALDGNYAANRIADALPVEIEPLNPEIDSSATVIVVLDQSGSMGAQVGGRTKLALAAEGAASVIRLLRSFDKVGVEAVQSTVDWVVPVRTIGDDTAALEARVRAIPVGGDGIFVYTGLLAAQKEMERATTPLRHVILFSDTTDAAEQVKGIDYGDFVGWPSGRPNSMQIAQELRAKGVTLSVIGVGEGADGPWNPSTYQDMPDDTAFLKELARVGGGRYYRTTDASQLRGLFVQDARRLLDTHAREEDIHVHVLNKHISIDGVDIDHAPKLHGYHELKARPAAQVVVADQKGDPILSRWPYGLGEVAVWASDAGPRWARDWTSWPGFARFWAQLARSALRRREGDTTAIEADFAGNAAKIRVVRRTEANNAAVPTARVIDPSGNTLNELPLRVVEPGVYEAPIDVANGREPTIELLDDNGKVISRRTIVRPPSSELRERGPDMSQLARIAAGTGGTLSPTTIDAPARELPSTTPLGMWCILFAILLLPVDAMFRRIARG
jgi:uncharacterized membrane protein